MLDAKDLPGMVYLIPCPKSPHGCDVDPTGEYIVGSGKLAAVIPVFSFSKIQQAIAIKHFDGDYDGIPVIKYEAALYGEVKKPGLGPLHTEFDGKGNAYTSCFVSSEIVKWNIKDLKVLDRQPTLLFSWPLMYSRRRYKKALGKISDMLIIKLQKTGICQQALNLRKRAQLFDISGDKMKLLLDFPTIGEPHYAQAVSCRSYFKKFFKNI